MAGLAFALLCALLCVAQTQQPENKTALGQSHGLPKPLPQKPIEENTEPTQKDKTDYSQEPFVFEWISTRVRFENDGTGVREFQVGVRVQSEAGVQRLGQLAFGYNAANETLEIGQVEVRKASGGTMSITRGAVQDLTAPVARDAPVYTDVHEKHITVPGLAPGDTLVYQITWRMHTPLAPNRFWLQQDFIEDAIVLDEQFELNLPAGRRVKLKTHPNSSPSIREENGRRIYKWQHKNLERAANEEEEAEAKPKKKAEKKPETPAIQLTTFQSWDEVGRWYGPLVSERAVADDAIRAKAQELIRGRSSPAEKAEALYDFVAGNYRYISLSFGLGRYQPHDASEVFANRYGDCKDKHTLLAALLSAAGLEAYPVLIPTGRKIDPDVPSPLQFDHLITAVPIGNDLLWMDTTTEVAPFRFLSANLRKKQALLIPTGATGGTPRLVEAPADPPFPVKQRVEVTGKITDFGKLEAQVRYVLRGDSELLLRSAFRRTPQADWKKLAQLLAYADGFHAEVTEVSASDPAATQQPFEVSFKISQANYLDWSKKRSELPLPMPRMNLPQVGEEDDPGPDAEPIQLGSPTESLTSVQLEVPAAFSSRSPVAVNITRDYADYRSHYSAEGQTIKAERTLRSRVRELPAERGRDFRAFARAVRSDEGQTLTVESTVAGAPEVPATAKSEELHAAALTALDNGEFASAVKLFQRVVELKPKHKWAWNNLGRAYLAQLKWEEAVAAFRKQIELNPYDEYAYNNLGRALQRQQKFEEAAEAFRKQIEINPLDRWAHTTLGLLYREQRKYADAVTELEKALAITPKDPNIYVGLGDAYLNLRQDEKALEMFNKAVELAPLPPIWNNIAYQLSLKKVHLDRAQEYAESAVAAVTAHLRNVTLSQLRLMDLAQVSSLAAYWDTLGWVHFAKGDLDKAEKYVRAAWLLNQHGEVGDHLGQVYEKQGRKQDAIRTYAQAITSSRPVPETRGRLASLLVGGAAAVDRMLMTAGGELSELRTMNLGKFPDQSGSAEYFVLIGADRKVEQLKFVSGKETLRPLEEKLRSVTYPVEFPDDTRTKLVRRGVLSCSSATRECIFVLHTADTVTSVN